MDNVIFVAVAAIVVLVIVVIAKTAVVVPQQSAFVVEQLGVRRPEVPIARRM